MKLFQQVKEIRSQQGELHFQRYAIIETHKWALYIHRIYKEDKDEHLHSHPWNFMSVILWGAYIEQYAPEYNRMRVKCEGSFSKADRNYFHKIVDILRGPVTTLFFTWGTHQPWHYWVKGEKVESTEYRKQKNIARMAQEVAHKIDAQIVKKLQEQIPVLENRKILR